jgi:calcium-translocating P-type ATPase
MTIRASEPNITQPAAATPGRIGLSTQEAARRLASGRNELATPAKSSAITELVQQLVHFFAVMLWVASALAWIAGMPQLAIAIAIVIVVNATFSFAQERRSDKAAERLRQLLPRRVNVRRDGRLTTIDSSEVVVGDILLLAAGDRVSADCRVDLGRTLRADASMLTGESEPIDVATGDTLNAGMFVVDGEGEAEVVAIGAHTRLAQISALTTNTKRPQRPLTAELDRVVRMISVIAVGAGLLSFMVATLVGLTAADGVVFAIGVTVALVPEGLLPTVTLSLAIGAQRMAHRNALVRHLDAVETLGSTTFICTDKTGTLTTNQMTVQELWTPRSDVRIAGAGLSPRAELTVLRGESLDEAAAMMADAARCGSGCVVEAPDGWVARGDPMEAAIDSGARRLGVGVDVDRAARHELDRFPFDSRRMRMSVILSTGGPASSPAQRRLIVKGAVEAVLDRCADDEVAERCRTTAAAMAERGMRVLCIASRDLDPSERPLDASEAEVRLTTRGLVALLDPPRDTAPDALARCRRAGIKVAMVTGDHLGTATAVASAVGLSLPGSPRLLGRDLPTDPDALAELLDHDGIVIGRATPEDKLRIAQALRRRDHVVAMTGDGVNDGPALRAANIGVAMGRSGTDVAREAADLVLLDDDISTIVDAVAHGRATFLNVRRFLTYHLTDNVAELAPFVIWALSGGRIPLALSVMQILALDIGTDTMSATALGAEPPSANVLDGPPVSGRLLNRTVAVRAFGLLGPIETTVSMGAFFVTFLLAGWRPGQSFPTDEGILFGASGAAFLAVVLGQKANAWACRSATRSPWQLDWLGNPLLVVTAAVELVFALACLVVPPMAKALENGWPPAGACAVAVCAVPAVWGIDSWDKRRRRRQARPAVTTTAAGRSRR